ncbi:hypothetical protein ACRU00_000279, partial [Escherichia coli]
TAYSARFGQLTFSKMSEAVARRMQERAAAGWRTFDSASIELFPAVTDFTMFSVERLDKTEAHKSLHWIARLCALR